jgi:two-component system response regulator AtoC
VIAATSRNLSEAVEQGIFRQDLYYRLHVVPITLPPLRERPEDITPLVQHFLKKHAQELGKPIQDIAPDAMKVLLECEWKGNVRELENVLERTVVMTEGQRISTACLPQDLLQRESDITLKIPENRISMKGVLSEITGLAERELIRRALQQTGNNRTRAAQLLEISHRALMYKLKDYQIS